MKETVDPLSRKAYVFNLLPPLCIETGTIWKKLVTSLLWLIVAALTLTAWLPSSFWFSERINWLCFLIHPLTPNALTLQSSWDQNKRCFLTAACRSFTLMFLNSGQFHILLESSASRPWSLCVCLVSSRSNLHWSSMFTRTVCLYLCSFVKTLRGRMLS